ncbi:hypothetical protein Zmor_004789 [Zophobas morio]|uniref:Caspase-6 n=1 Tax=Zophobas morio TaxID=2755281 RepID=A0AA38MLL1_9CUCU|nr:hypothetical protein Zmor_004789 [Zophobas morio]
MQTDAKAFSVALEPPKGDPFNPEKKTLLTPTYEIKHIEKITLIKSLEAESEQFTERHQLPLAPFEYQRSGTEPGLVLIFNQEAFDDKSYRLGSRRDVNEIINCVSRLGFNINDKCIFTDYTRDQILETVKAIVCEDLSRFNSLIVFFLTHGDNFNMLHAHDCSLQTHNLWEEFSKCPQLEGKPKMFVFQACKGDSFSTVSEDTNDKIDLVDDSTFQSDYIGPDMLIVYSTTEGNVSFRDPQNGTWFIQELCKNFLAYGRRDDVVSLIMRTTKCLCRNYYHNEGDIIKKQMPVFVSTLRRKFYLNRTKERNVWLQLLQNQDNLTQKVKELERKVNSLLQEKDKRGK